MAVDHQRFEAAREAALSRTRGEGGVGTLSEKTLHATLKAYYEPDVESREVSIGGFVADIVGENGVIEIQTRGFDRLRKKLAAFLEVTRVTVVYPVPKIRWLRWVDPETGEVSERKKTTAKGSAFDVFPELYKIKSLIAHPNFTLKIVLLELTDYRYLDGYGAKKKIRSTKGERVPDVLLEELVFEKPADYAGLLPAALEEPFTAKELAKAAKRPLGYGQPAVNVLTHLGVLERAGTQNRAYLYRRADAEYDTEFEHKI